MILIFSEEEDISTYEIIRWMIFLGKKFFRVNREDNISIKIIDLKAETVILKINQEELNLNTVQFVWYRRGFFNFNVSAFLESESDSIIQTLKEESSFLNVFLMKYLTETSTCINDYFTSFNNKLITLREAKNVGLNIPRTFLTSFSNEVRKSDMAMITKSIGAQYMSLREENSTIELAYTEQVELNNNEVFFPSLFQEEIQKKIEIRTFFLLDVFYSMAIFSQSNNRTKTDFRKYDQLAPNRTVPYNLPTNIEKKLIKLLKKMKLNCCSIDLILDRNQEYVFLEVNPIGQFGMISKPCNYHLEKVIANKLG